MGAEASSDMSVKLRNRVMILAAAGALLLTACGGGESADEVPPELEQAIAQAEAAAAAADAGQVVTPEDLESSTTTTIAAPSLVVEDEPVEPPAVAAPPIPVPSQIPGMAAPPTNRELVVDATYRYVAALAVADWSTVEALTVGSSTGCSREAAASAAAEHASFNTGVEGYSLVTGSVVAAEGMVTVTVVTAAGPIPLTIPFSRNGDTWAVDADACTVLASATAAFDAAAARSDVEAALAAVQAFAADAGDYAAPIADLDAAVPDFDVVGAAGDWSLGMVVAITSPDAAVVFAGDASGIWHCAAVGGGASAHFASAVSAESVDTFDECSSAGSPDGWS